MKNIFRVEQASGEHVALIQGISDKIWKRTFSGMIPPGQVELMYSQQYTAPSLLKQMEEGQLFFLLYDGSRAIGFLSISWKERKQGEVKLNKFYCVPEYHGSGAAGFLLGFLKDFVVKQLRGFSIVLNVNRRNSRAISFYKKMNFRIVEEVDVPLQQYMLNDYIMRLDLS